MQALRELYFDSGSAMKKDLEKADPKWIGQVFFKRRRFYSERIPAYSLGDVTISTARKT